MDVAIQVAFIGFVGALIVALYTAHQERERQRLEAELKSLNLQIEELYGPLFGLIQRSKSIFDLSLMILPSEAGEHRREQWNERDWEIWRYLVENYLAAHRLRMAELVTSKSHLIEGEGMPEIFNAFLTHEAQAGCLYKLWKDKGISKDAGQAGIKYPTAFDTEVEESLKRLRSQYKSLLRRRRKI